MPVVIRIILQFQKTFSIYLFFFCLNPLPNDNILDWFKSKALADDKKHATKKIKKMFVDKWKTFWKKEKTLVRENNNFSRI